MICLQNADRALRSFISPILCSLKGQVPFVFTGNIYECIPKVWTEGKS